MLEYWNVGGIAGLHDCMIYVHPYIHATMRYRSSQYPTTPSFHHSIIPGWDKQNGGLKIPYYQQFVEITIHDIMFLLKVV